MLDAMVEVDECLAKLIGDVGGVEENCGTSSISIVHGNISNVKSMHASCYNWLFFVFMQILFLKFINNRDDGF